MKAIKYFTYAGSYFGAVKVHGRWLRIKHLNRIDKTGWDRHQGPPNGSMMIALRHGQLFDARKIFPDRIIKAK